MSTVQEAMEHVLAQRELAEKLAAAREEQREAIRLQIEALKMARGDLGESFWNGALVCLWRSLPPLTFEPLRIRIEDLEARTATENDKRLLQKLLEVLSRHVGETGESEGAVDVVGRLSKEREQIKSELGAAKSELVTLRASWADENNRADRGVELLERVVVLCTAGNQEGAALLDEVEAWLSALKKEAGASTPRPAGETGGE